MKTSQSNEYMNGILEIYKYGRLYQSLEEGLPVTRSSSFKTLSIPDVLFITSFPPRECGIATYSQDLIAMIRTKFQHSFESKVCALVKDHQHFDYQEEVSYVLNTQNPIDYITLMEYIESSEKIEMVVIQHEFGFFDKHEADLSNLMAHLSKPIVLIFHTVLPNPDKGHLAHVQDIIRHAAAVVVMTKHSSDILVKDYETPADKIRIIPHGTHLVRNLDKALLKEKYGLSDRKVVSTFGLLSEGKSIETTLKGIPAIIKENPDILFLIIGKTHPSVIEREGEKYRESLKKMIDDLDIAQHVQFINAYLPLNELLDYLQLSDIYLFTSKNPNQAVSGTFSYALSCGCPIISTPIPHAMEVLGKDAGLIIDFENSKQLASAVNKLFGDDELKKRISDKSLQKIAATSWENSALSHMELFEKLSDSKITPHYTPPALNLAHIHAMTHKFGMVQFAKINHPDLDSGYTLDDNARAMIAMCMHFELTKDVADLALIETYLNVIEFCQQADGSFLNYVNEKEVFTHQNNMTNLEDSNGRAIWALGFLISKRDVLPIKLIGQAERLLLNSLGSIVAMHSTRAMSFVIKGLYLSNIEKKSPKITMLIVLLANRLVQMYRHESSPKWNWFESYLTYANSLLPEAMLCAYLETNEKEYRKIATSTFNFLLSNIFKDNQIKVVSNQGWFLKGQSSNKYGEQPIDVAYTIMALSIFYEVFKDPYYLRKMKIAFNWFLGHNHLKQIIYNPCTGGCYDGLEEHQVNLNQGAESTVSYLLSRLTIDKYLIPVVKKMPEHILAAQKLN